MSERSLYPDEPAIRDRDGNLLREYDDVILLRDLKPTSGGNCRVEPDVIPAGTRATAIMLLDETSGRFDLECYLGEREFAFSTDTADHLSLVQRAEDKLKGRT
jgi:uncharacterized Zn ribbon protein